MGTIFGKIAEFVDKLDIETMTLTIAGQVKRGIDKEGIKLSPEEFEALYRQVKEIVIRSKKI
jgi:hypothetical protein